MQELSQLVAFGAAMWIILIGFAIALRGPDAGIRVFVWPFRMAFRAVRTLVGGVLIAIGEAIRGR